MAGTIPTEANTEAANTRCLNGVRPRWPEQSSRLGMVATINEVSMESGLDGRNNVSADGLLGLPPEVSMESGLDGRNNYGGISGPVWKLGCLNGVRPRWPEQ